MPRPALSRRTADLVALAGAILVTFLLELALAERKFALFGGGYGQSHTLDAAGEIAIFAAGAIGCHVLLFLLLFALIRRLHRRATPPAVLRFDFLALAVGVFAAALIAKFEVLSYFSDAVSFQLIRNLGGGSLFDAFLFALSESGLMLGGAVAAILLWWVVRRMIRTRAALETGAPSLRLARPIIALAILLPVSMVFANGNPDARYALTRFTAYGLLNGALEQASDVDRDGYGLYSAQIDRHPFDPARHPLALDIPGNGIDEDGFGGDLVFTGPDPIVPTPVLPAHKKHLVVIVLESTRADLLGKRLNGRVVAPNLEALARTGSSFPQAYSHVGFTTASLKSLFSGQLDPRAGDPSLFTDLKANGYRIGIFSGQPESFGDISQVVGMKQSADVFVDAETLKDERAFSFAAKGSLLVDEGKLLREFDRAFGQPAGWSQPHFVYFNFQSAHFPYHHPGMTDPLGIVPLARDQIAIGNRARVAETYWNAVSYADSRIGQVVARLKALGVWDDTVLAVTGDHGESLFDDNFLGHGHVINPQQTHIPLVVSIPGLSWTQPMGLRDMRGLFLAALGGARAAPPRAPTFLHIGPLDAPAAIGIVTPGGVFTTLTIDTEEIWFGDTGRRARYATLTGADRRRADRLVTEWGRQRWIAHLKGR